MKLLILTFIIGSLLSVAKDKSVQIFKEYKTLEYFVYVTDEEDVKFTVSYSKDKKTESFSYDIKGVNNLMSGVYTQSRKTRFMSNLGLNVPALGVEDYHGPYVILDYVLSEKLSKMAIDDTTTILINGNQHKLVFIGEDGIPIHFANSDAYTSLRANYFSIIERDENRKENYARELILGKEKKNRNLLSLSIPDRFGFGLNCVKKN